MKSKEFMRAKLETRTNADCSDLVVKDSRYHYHLRFDEPIRIDRLSALIDGVSAETSVGLELWEVHPSGVNDFEVSVRESKRREGIDGSQHSLGKFVES